MEPLQQDSLRPWKPASQSCLRVQIQYFLPRSDWQNQSILILISVLNFAKSQPILPSSASLDSRLDLPTSTLPSKLLARSGTIRTKGDLNVSSVEESSICTSTSKNPNTKDDNLFYYYIISIIILLLLNLIIYYIYIKKKIKFYYIN